MTTNASAGQMVWLLAQKDWQLVRGPMLAYGAIGLTALGLLSLNSELAFTIGMVLLVTVVVIVGAHMVFATVVNERGRQTLPFVMSLPISYGQYTAAKLIANVGIFFVSWLTITAAVVALIGTRESLPDGLIPFAVIVLGELAIAFVLTLGIAMVMESEPWTVVVMSIGNVSISIFMISVARIPAIGSHMEGPIAVWNATALTILAAELIIVTALLAITVFAQSRKQDYL